MFTDHSFYLSVTMWTVPYFNFGFWYPFKPIPFPFLSSIVSSFHFTPWWLLSLITISFSLVIILYLWPNKVLYFLLYNIIRTFQEKGFIHCKFPQCFQIFLDYNEIDSVAADSFEGLTNLRTLSLRENTITDIDSGVFAGTVQYYWDKDTIFRPRIMTTQGWICWNI